MDTEKSPKEKLLKMLGDLQREVTLKEVSEILSTTIKQDETSKLITFLAMLLTYTSEDQQNIGFKSESCRGKSYIPLEIAQYFPQDDVLRTAYCSPTAFFHEWGDWNEKRKVNVIDLSKKILIFMDQPHDNLLVRLRPLLSHDNRELLHRITDRTAKYGMRAKHVLIRGYPTVIFCTTAMKIDDQERTRLLLLSPEASKEKIEEALDLLAERLGNRDAFKKQLESNPKRKWLMARVHDIKTARIENIVIPNVHEICERFKTYREHLIPRHQRDFPRLLALIKAHAILNCRQREEGPDKTIIANEVDIQAGFKLYEQVVAPNELGVSPEILEIWDKAIQPAFQDNYNDVLKEYEGLTRKEVMDAYYKVFHRTLSKKRLVDEIIPALETAGFIIEENDPTNKRQKVITPIANAAIYTQEVCTTKTMLTDDKLEVIEYQERGTQQAGICSSEESLDSLKKVKEFTEGKEPKNE